jgi:hypothetical protein
MENIDPVSYGELRAQVSMLSAKVDDMDKDIKTLLALANQSKGGFWMGMIIASGIGGALTWVANHWLR